MKRSKRFAVSILAAAITFGSLMVFAKPIHGFRQTDKSHFGYIHHHDCNRDNAANIQKKVTNQEKAPWLDDSSGIAQ